MHPSAQPKGYRLSYVQFKQSPRPIILFENQSNFAPSRLILHSCSPSSECLCTWSLWSMLMKIKLQCSGEILFSIVLILFRICDKHTKHDQQRKIGGKRLSIHTCVWAHTSLYTHVQYCIKEKQINKKKIEKCDFFWIQFVQTYLSLTLCFKTKKNPCTENVLFNANNFLASLKGLLFIGWESALVCLSVWNIKYCFM